MASPTPAPINIPGAFPPTISECTRLFTALGEEDCGFSHLEIQLRSNTDMNRRGQGGSWLVFPQNSAVQINAYTNHGMQRTFRATFPFPYCRTASLWGRRSLHLQMHFCGPQHSTLTIWEVWFHKTNKSCPHFPNFAVLQNKNLFSWELSPLCKELASWWLAVAFRIRSCFLCSHTLWLHLTDACCLNCPFIHGSSLKEGHWLTQCPQSSYSLPYSGR